MRISSRSTDSDIFPYACADAPHESLPIMPPMVQVGWLDGRGPTIRPSRSSTWLTASSTAPACTVIRRPVTSTDSTAPQCLDQSMTTAALQHCPARLVPPPRDSTGTSRARHAATAATPASSV